MPACSGATVKRTTRTGRWFGGLLAALVACVVWFASAPRLPASSPARLYAFVPDSPNPHELRRMLASALSPVQVTLFGRLRDLRSAVSAQRPDMVLTRASLLEELGMSADIRGLAKGADKEAFVLVTRDRPLASLQQITTTTTGIVDMSDSQTMLELARRLLGGRVPLTLRRAVKLLDLLAMLRLGLADSVLLPKRVVPQLQLGTEMVLAITELPNAQVGLYAVHVADANQRERTRHAFKGLRSGLNHELGVDEWR